MSSSKHLSLDETNGVVALCGDSTTDDMDDSSMAQSNLLSIMWCGTAGLGGHLLGTDEENVVFLKYLVYNVQKNQTIAEFQYTVRPPPPQSCNNSNGDSSIDLCNAPIQLSETCRRDFELTEDRIRSTGQPLEFVLKDMEEKLRSITYCLDNKLAYSNHHNHHNHQNNISNNNEKALAIINSSNNNNINKPILITDGQLHLRQVLHPKAAFNNLELPETYNKFFDLRKEFRDLYNREEVSSVPEMANFLDINTEEHDNLGTRATRSMARIIARMIHDGHTFQGPEQILVKLEPGVVSKGEEVDNGCVVRARGLPWMSSDTAIAKFFRGLNVAKGGVALCMSSQGRRNGEALIRFLCSEHRDMALRRHKHHMGGRYIEVYKATGEDFISVAGGNNNEANQFLARGSVIIRMRGLPYECSAKQVVDFFESAPNNVKLLDNEDGVLFVRKSDGRPTGDAFVMLICEEDVPKALQKHKNSIGSRYIELFRSTAAEVMNRSMDIRLLDQQQQPQALAPLISHLPTMAPMIPQQSVAQGPRKDCIRLRGLPYDAQIDHILNFLGDYSKCILYQGVHMVYTPQGQPSGEAFIQMSNESSAWSATKNRHKCMMGYGKKSRYVEVFQCSGDDMNYVLSGAAAPANPSGVPSVQPARPIVSTSGSPMLSPYYPLAPAPAVLSHHHTLTAAPRLTAFAPTIATPYPTMFYWSYPSPPVSPTTGYYSSLTHHTIIPTECIPIHAAAELTMHPGEPVATM